MDWNAAFVTALELPAHSPDEATRRAKRVQRVSDSFLAAAVRIGKCIVDERDLPLAERKVQPAVGYGGHAGGEKFVSEGILFKYARDWQGIYQGSDAHAAKAAGNELRALRAVLSCYDDEEESDQSKPWPFAS